MLDKGWGFKDGTVTLGYGIEWTAAMTDDGGGGEKWAAGGGGGGGKLPAMALGR